MRVVVGESDRAAEQPVELVQPRQHAHDSRDVEPRARRVHERRGPATVGIVRLQFARRSRGGNARRASRERCRRPRQSGRQLAGSVSLGDYWRPTPTLQVQYGARVDGNRFLTTPAINPRAARRSAVATSALPNDVYVSPRIGLQWAYGKSSQIAYAPGAARPPQAVIHAGVGVFQNIASVAASSRPP